jgi:alkanesulfonate monooxygenase SsuD/methylene tetrahydromethanopterin reductase-like flavin-dependent oxidoreductase (luciferase family)
MAIAFDDNNNDLIVVAVVDWVVVLWSHGARSAGDRPLRHRVFGSGPSPSAVIVIILRFVIVDDNDGVAWTEGENDAVERPTSLAREEGDGMDNNACDRQRRRVQ